MTESKNVKLVDLYIRWTTTTTKIFAQKAAGNLTTNYLKTLAGSDNLQPFTMKNAQAIKLFKSVEEARMLRVRIGSAIDRKRHWNKGYEKALHHIGLLNKTYDRVQRRDRAFWQYLKDNNLDLTAI